MSQRVVITGIGLVTPHGSDRESSWRGFLSGKSRTTWLDDRDFGLRHPLPGFAGAPASQIAPELPTGINESQPLFRQPRDQVISLALCAAQEALTDAHFDTTTLTPEERNRTGCVIGTSKGGLISFQRAFETLHSSHNLYGSRNVDDQLTADWLQFQPHAPAAAVSTLFDLRGPSLCPIAACATGLTCLVRAADLLRHGMCDVVVAGSSDASLHEAVLASFKRLGVLAQGFDDPATACRPFDRQRNGFVVGEGASIIVMEKAEHAEKRGASPYAEWLSGGMAADISAMTQLETDGVALTRLIQQILRSAEVTSDEVDYINLHGTGTLLNDVCETKAVHAALGKNAKRVACSGLKGSIGHLLGAAGSVETSAALLAMRDSCVPPTVNLNQPDDQCDLDYTAGRFARRRIETTLKLSLGFGGHLVAALFRRHAVCDQRKPF